MNKNYIAVLLLGTCVSTQALAGFTDIHEDPLMDMEMKRTAYRTQLEKDEAMTCIWDNQLSSLYYNIDDKEQKNAIKALRTAFQQRIDKRKAKVELLEGIDFETREKEKRVTSLKSLNVENIHKVEYEKAILETLQKDAEQIFAKCTAIQGKVDQIEIEIEKDEGIPVDKKAERIIEKKEPLERELQIQKKKHEACVGEKIKKENFIKELESKGKRLEEECAKAESEEIFPAMMNKLKVFGMYHELGKEVKKKDCDEITKENFLNYMKKKVAIFQSILKITEVFPSYFSNSLNSSLANILAKSIEIEGNAQIEKQTKILRDQYIDKKKETLSVAQEKALEAYRITHGYENESLEKARTSMWDSKYQIEKFDGYDPFSSFKMDLTSFDPNALLQKAMGGEENLQKFAKKNLIKWQEREEALVKESQDNFRKFVFIMQNISGKNVKSEQGQDKNHDSNRNIL